MSGPFASLAPFVTKDGTTLQITKLADGRLSVVITHSVDEKMAAANPALTRPMVLTATPDELDTQLGTALTSYETKRQSLTEQAAAEAAALQAADDARKAAVAKKAAAAAVKPTAKQAVSGPPPKTPVPAAPPSPPPLGGLFASTEPEQPKHNNDAQQDADDGNVLDQDEAETEEQAAA